MRMSVIAVDGRFVRRMVLHRAPSAAIAVALVPLLFACGGGDSQPTTKPGTIRGPEVEMTDQLRFMPDKLTVKVGDTVTWRNVGSVAHTVTDDPAKAANKEHAKLPSGAEPWDSGLVMGGQSFSRKFDSPGEYAYFCVPHEASGMLATLTITS